MARSSGYCIIAPPPAHAAAGLKDRNPETAKSFPSRSLDRGRCRGTPPGLRRHAAAGRCGPRGPAGVVPGQEGAGGHRTASKGDVAVGKCFGGLGIHACRASMAIPNIGRDEQRGATPSGDARVHGAGAVGVLDGTGSPGVSASIRPTPTLPPLRQEPFPAHPKGRGRVPPPRRFLHLFRRIRRPYREIAPERAHVRDRARAPRTSTQRRRRPRRRRYSPR
jgi:hypothetical protein